jgi:Secretion system C-terminal sorting domain
LQIANNQIITLWSSVVDYILTIACELETKGVLIYDAVKIHTSLVFTTINVLCLLAHATLTQCLSEPICKTISVQLVDNEDIAIENNIVIYPNPTDGVLYIKVVEFQNLDNLRKGVILYNSLGQVLLKKDFLPEHLDLQGITSGVYFLKIGNKVWRVVKE